MDRISLPMIKIKKTNITKTQEKGIENLFAS